MERVILRSLGIWTGIITTVVKLVTLSEISKESALKQTQFPLLTKKILKIYIQYTALIYQINLKVFPVHKVALYLS